MASPTWEAEGVGMEEMDLLRVLKRDTVGFAGCFNGVRGKRKRGIKGDYVK